MIRAAHAAAPGKIILFGEHAVVHGQPAIAVPLAAVQVQARADPASAGSGLTIRAADIGRVFRFRDAAENHSFYNALIYPLRLALDWLHQSEPDLTITVQSTIPIGGGLGSGAALAAALIRVLLAALDSPLPRETVNALVYEVEKRHHGSPSGVDNTVIVYAQPVYFVRGQPLETFEISRPFTLLVADSGISSPTHITVGDVRQLYDAEPDRVGAIFARIGEIVRAARTAIESGKIELLGSLMNENHALLRDLTVSSDKLERLCRAALDAGAQGAKLSGGGRGGNIIALAEPGQTDQIAAALRQQGAARVIETVVRS